LIPFLLPNATKIDRVASLYYEKIVLINGQVRQSDVRSILEPK